MTTSEQTQKDISDYVCNFICYDRGAHRRAWGALERLFPNAIIGRPTDHFDAVVTINGKTVPVFINVYPVLESQQVTTDFHNQQSAANGQRYVALYVTPNEHVAALEEELRHHNLTNAGFYIFKLDGDETAKGSSWKSYGVTPVAAY